MPQPQSRRANKVVTIISEFMVSMATTVRPQESRQTKPENMLVVQEEVDGPVEGGCGGKEVGADVIGCGWLVVDSSQHPQNRPGDSHMEVGDEGRVVGGGTGGPLVGMSQQPQMTPGVSHVVVEEGVREVGVVGSRQPDRPGCLHVVVVMVEVGMVVEIAEFGVVVVVVVGSLQPNQPGVLHVSVVVPDSAEVVEAVVVVSSKQPHHPGVLQVDVLVEVEDVVVAVEVVVISDPLLRKNFHNSQSKHSSCRSQVGTVSYASMTSLITDLIRCVPIATRHPLSSTVS